MRFCRAELIENGIEDTRRICPGQCLEEVDENDIVARTWSWTCGEPCRWIMMKSGVGTPPWKRGDRDVIGPVDSTNKRTDDPGHGWFVIAGVQTGERTLETQLEGLGSVLLAASAQKLTVLDLGCAEGLVGMEFGNMGAAHVTGIESVATRVQMARQIAKDRDLRADFSVGDVENLDIPAMATRGIVLALSIAQKMPAPDVWIQQVSTLARNYFILRLPDPIIKDRRSAFREIDPVTLLPDFNLTAGFRNSLGEYVMVFERRA